MSSEQTKILSKLIQNASRENVRLVFITAPHDLQGGHTSSLYLPQDRCNHASLPASFITPPPFSLSFSSPDPHLLHIFLLLSNAPARLPPRPVHATKTCKQLGLFSRRRLQLPRRLSNHMLASRLPSSPGYSSSLFTLKLPAAGAGECPVLTLLLACNSGRRYMLLSRLSPLLIH